MSIIVDRRKQNSEPNNTNFMYLKIEWIVELKQILQYLSCDNEFARSIISGLFFAKLS